jgi:hypothetical protein
VLDPRSERHFVLEVAMDKRCSSCREIKDVTEFHFNKTGKHGRHNTCKSCRASEKKEYMINYKDKIKHRNRMYNLFNKDVIAQWKRDNNNKLREYQRSYNKNNPEKQAARIAIRSAVKAKRIPKVSDLICSICNKKRATHYHHHKGYSTEFALDVIPVCLQCHHNLHSQRNGG